MYEYECEACGHRFEQIRKFSDPSLTECPKCGGLLRKLVSSPAIQFKGSGWYITDYARSGSKSESAKSDAASEASEKKGSEKKTGETKADAGSKDSTTSSDKPSSSSPSTDSSAKKPA